MNTALRWFLILSLFILFFVGFFHPINAFTQDLGRHLVLGKIITQTRSVPQTNMFSYTNPRFPFINSHWLSEVIFYWITTLFGLLGLLITTTAIAALSCALPLIFALRRFPVLLCGISALFYLFILFERTDVRPEVFSFLFTAICITLLYRFREKTTKLIFLIVPLELLWVNIHIYFPIGVLLLFLFLIDELFTKRKLLTQRTKLLAFTLLFSGLVLFINPNTIHGAFFPLNVFNNYGYSIEENQNIFFLQSLFPESTIVWFEITVAILVILAIFNYKKLRIIDVLLIIVFSIAGASAIRNFPLFVFTTFIPFVYLLTQLQSTFQKTFFSFLSTSQKSFFYFGLFIIFFFVVGISSVKIAEQKSTGFGVEKGAATAADFFINNNIQGPMYNNFDIGSFLIYRLYPKEKVFVDGRPEAYPASFFQHIYIPMQENPSFFTEVDKQYHFNVLFLGHWDQTPWANNFLQQIVTNQKWKMIYLDNYAVIFLKDAPQNQSLIKKYQITQTSFKLPKTADETSLLHFAFFFDKVKWQKQEQVAYQQILQINPTNCSALTNLSILLQYENNPAASLYQQRLQANCL